MWGNYITRKEKCQQFAQLQILSFVKDYLNKSKSYEKSTSGST